MSNTINTNSSNTMGMSSMSMGMGGMNNNIHFGGGHVNIGTGNGMDNNGTSLPYGPLRPPLPVPQSHHTHASTGGAAAAVGGAAPSAVGVGVPSITPVSSSTSHDPRLLVNHMNMLDMQHRMAVAAVTNPMSIPHQLPAIVPLVCRLAFVTSYPQLHHYV
jgi:hypothetical protein